MQRIRGRRRMHVRQRRLLFDTEKEVAYPCPSTAPCARRWKEWRHRGYTAVPIMDENNKYVGTLTEGDLLWKFKNTPSLDLQSRTEKIMLKDIPRRGWITIPSAFTLPSRSALSGYRPELCACSGRQRCIYRHRQAQVKYWSITIKSSRASSRTRRK